MTTEQRTAEFEEYRPHLRAVAYRMLGSVSEADDAVQEAWLRASRADTSDVEDMRAWLTTVVARVSLNALRSRRSKREEPLGVHVPEPIVSGQDGLQPEHEALLAVRPRRRRVDDRASLHGVRHRPPEPHRG